jgi:hypothetical protein
MPYDPRCMYENRPPIIACVKCLEPCEVGHRYCSKCWRGIYGSGEMIWYREVDSRSLRERLDALTGGASGR